MYVALIIAFVLGWIAGFVLAIIMAASGKASRMEERIAGYNPSPKKSRRPNKPTPAPPPKIEIATKNDPRTD